MVWAWKLDDQGWKRQIWVSRIYFRHIEIGVVFIILHYVCEIISPVSEEYNWIRLISCLQNVFLKSEINKIENYNQSGCIQIILTIPLKNKLLYISCYYQHATSQRNPFWSEGDLGFHLIFASCNYGRFGSNINTNISVNK